MLLAGISSVDHHQGIFNTLHRVKLCVTPHIITRTHSQHAHINSQDSQGVRHLSLKSNHGCQPAFTATLKCDYAEFIESSLLLHQVLNDNESVHKRVPTFLHFSKHD